MEASHIAQPAISCMEDMSFLQELMSSVITGMNSHRIVTASEAGRQANERDPLRAIMRDPAFFPNPENFIPSRWLTETGKINEKLKSYNFGFGRR